jgi:hypothetical protein
LVVGLGAPSLLAGLLLYAPPQTLGQWCVFALFSAFTLSMVYLLVETLTVRVILGAEGLAARSPWRGWRTLLWEEIVEVSYSPTNGWFVLTGPQREKIRVSILLVGIRSFVGTVQERVARERCAKADQGFAEVKQTLPSFP